MRFVPAFCIRDGMTLGKTLYGPNGEVLLREGTYIKEAYIEKILQLGYSGAYIDDDLSQDIEVHEIISAELKNKTVNTVKNTFIQIERHGIESAAKSLQDISELVERIFEDILSHKDFVVNMHDLKIFDDYTFFHSTNVTVLSVILGMAAGLDKKALLDLGMAALLHDLGKVFIPKEILNKVGPLSDDEFATMKEHPIKGYEHVKRVLSMSTRTYVGILQHHEKFDGGGYPDGKAGEEIALFGRIIAIADVYDALVSDRPYRKALLPSEAMEYLMGGGGGQFDYNLIKIFAQKIAPYPVGSYVYLSDGKEGLVVENYMECCLRPKIKVVKEAANMIDEPFYIDLQNDTSTLAITICGIGNGDISM